MNTQPGSLTIFLRIASIASCLAATIGYAQNPIQLFPPVDVKLSAHGTGSGPDQVIFNSSTLNLSCPATDVHAVISSTPGGTGNVLVDNFVYLTVNPADSDPVGPISVCGSGATNQYGSNCFTNSYERAASIGRLTGQDPDTFAATGGIAPIDISARLSSGPVQVTIALADTGGYLASSSIYLNTNCTSSGVSGGGQITGVPISSTNPTPAELTQNFTFNSGADKVVSQIYDLSFAEAGNSLTIPAGGVTPTVADVAIDPLVWKDEYVKGTSFATSKCLIHDGELLNGSPACKLYTLTCQIGQNSTGTGAQCPTSTIRNEVFEDYFDGPAFTLPDIHEGCETFHQGIGYLMANEGWQGGMCAFDQASGLQDEMCPKNLLTQFVGPGFYGSKGTTNHPNSSFITVAPVPEDLTTVSFNFCAHEVWVNRHTVEAKFSSKPPVVRQPNNGFVAAPIASITYGISPKDSVPLTEFPIDTDVVLANSIGCPSPGDSNPPMAKTFTPAKQTITVPEDGKYLVHYFATDCAGTEELSFYQDSSRSWHTTFYTKKLYVDTVPPRVESSPVLSPAPTIIHGVAAYKVGEKVTATYSCSDDFSGVEICGSHWFARTVPNPPAQTTVVNTANPGTKTFTVSVWDAAQNRGVSKSVMYTVVK